MGFIRNNNVWKINKILAGISGGIKPEDVQDMIDTSLTPIETAIEGKQDTLTAGDNITISDENVISATVPAPITYTSDKPIVIDENNKIKMDGWTEITLNDLDNVNLGWFKNHELLIRYNANPSPNIYYYNPILYYASYPIGSEFKLINLTNSHSEIDWQNLNKYNSTHWHLEGYGKTISNSGTITFKAYELNGTVIDSSNVSNYFDSNDNYKIIKPFILEIFNHTSIITPNQALGTDPNKYISFELNKGNLVYHNLENNYNKFNIKLIQLYNACNDGTYSISLSGTITSNVYAYTRITVNNGNYEIGLSNYKMYYRECNIGIE